MATSTDGEFDPKEFLASVGAGRTAAKVREGQAIEPRLALQLDEAHGRPGRGFRDRLGIPLVVLLRLAQDTAEVVGSAAGFHCHYAGRQRSGKMSSGVIFIRRPATMATTTAAAVIRPPAGAKPGGGHWQLRHLIKDADG